MHLVSREIYKTSLYSAEVLKATENDSLATKIEANSLHNFIAISRSPLRVAARGKGGGCSFKLI